MNRLARVGAVAMALCGLGWASSAMAFGQAPQPGSVVWDQALGTGSIDTSLADSAQGTNYADAVTFIDTTVVGGINLFSNADLGSHTGASDFQLKILADNAGTPGATLFTSDIGLHSTRLDVAPGVNQYDFSFAPHTFAGGTTYWVGLSGNGFSLSLLTLRSPQDGHLARFAGTAFDGMPGLGDQMFQLTAAAVPEPQTAGLMLLGLATLLGAARRRTKAAR